MRLFSLKRSLLTIILCLPPTLAYGADFSGKVVGVIDGDSLRVMHDGKAEQIRLYGIDCPERMQAFGTKAKEATSILSFGKDVTVQPITKDRYGRTVASVTFPNGAQLNEELVRQGMCWWYRKYAPHDERLRGFEETARVAKRGLWAEPHPVPPWEWRAAIRPRTSSEPGCSEAFNRLLLTISVAVGRGECRKCRTTYSVWLPQTPGLRFPVRSRHE